MNYIFKGKKELGTIRRTVAKVECNDRYTMRCDEWSSLAEYAQFDPFSATSLAFRFGYVKGQRAEKKAQKGV
jgi:hypothetical protein